ncbi:Arginine-tRNA-protein transferase, partial [Opisthorchis viverrini]
MGTKRLTVSDYQYLIDRGWRRSGTYCYKPMNKVTCCPCYTIRCDAAKFRPSRSHKRLLKAVALFLTTGVMPKLFGRSGNQWRAESLSEVPNHTNPATLGARGDIPNTEYAGSQEADSWTSATSARFDCSQTTSPEVDTFSTFVVPAGDVQDTSKRSSTVPKLTKAHTRRWNARLARMKARALNENRPFELLLKEYEERRRRRLAKNAPKELEYFLAQEPNKGQGKHHIEIRLVRSSPSSNEFNSTLDTSYQLYKKYQVTVHGDKPDECTMGCFTRFLVKSPLVSDDAGDSPNTSSVPSMGSYHQQYWLDGVRLIAVGVIDILPRCLSSVYLYYDPDYSFLHLGTYSALRELGFVRDLIRTHGLTSVTPHPLYVHFDSYYMGYYIRSCPKMSYKAQFHPSYLACPETYIWVPVKSCLQRLDSAPGGKYARFSDESATDVHAISEPLDPVDLDRKIVCRISSNDRRRRRERLPPEPEDDKRFGVPVTLDFLRRHITPEGLQIFREWAKLLGRRALDGNFQIKFKPFQVVKNGPTIF